MDFSQWGTPSEEWLSFIQANPNALVSPDHLPSDKLQELANSTRANNAAARLAASGIGPLVSTQDHTAPTRDGATIGIRAYRPNAPAFDGAKLPTFVYLHGGGFIFGSLDTERFHCSWMAHALSMNVIHLCYRHTPQVSGLTAWHDALDGFDWILEHADLLSIDTARVLVGGVSAGGNLTAAVVQREVKRARETGEPCRVKAQLLAVPNLLHGAAFPYHLFADREKSSPVQCEEAAVLHKKRIQRFTELLGTDVDPFDRTWSPGLAEEDELKGSPPTALLIAGWDPLRDEALWYAQKLKNAGVRTKVHIFPGLPHAFAGFLQVPSHKRWNDVLLESIRWAKADEGEWNIEVPSALPSTTEAVINALEQTTIDPPPKVQGDGNTI
ncbi:alpha/beta-hydrolase [Whalleya microplaca]|nr:alpha/beta-hydrolase [Whalleya microplaca]